MRRSRGVLVIALCAVLGLVSSACGANGATPAQQLRSWESGASYSSNQQQLDTDLSEIATGLRTGPLVAVKTACDGLGFDAGTAYGELPTSNEALTYDLNDYYLDLTNAAQSCSSARAFTPQDFARYRALITKASAKYAVAKRQEAKILGG